MGEVERLVAADLARKPVGLGVAEPGAALPADGEALAESEFRVLLDCGLRALNDRERWMVSLRFRADMTEEQIARTVGISPAHVSRLLASALTKLRAERMRSSDRAKAESSPATPADPAPPGRRSSRSSPHNIYGGRILVRMPGELHGQLVVAAKRENVSLNRYINDALWSSLSPAGAEPAVTSQGAADPRQRAIPVALATNLALLVLAGIAAIVLLVLALESGI